MSHRHFFSRSLWMAWLYIYILRWKLEEGHGRIEETEQENQDFLSMNELRLVMDVLSTSFCHILLVKTSNQHKLKGGDPEFSLWRDEWQCHFTMCMGGNVAATFENNLHTSGGTWSMERLNNLPKTTQLLSGRAKTELGSIWLSCSCFLPLYPTALGLPFYLSLNLFPTTYLYV